jgi:antirestriction protein
MSSTAALLPTTSPRIYVACLAAYNNGRLHGAWIDADQPADAIYEDVKRMLAASPEPGAEEWAIHDYEGFSQLRLSEWESFERVAAIAVGIAEHGEAFAAWLSNDSSRDPEDSDSFTDSYRGEWDSIRAYADNLADELGLWDVAEKAGSPYVVVDVDAFARDLDIELETAETGGHSIYVFDPC